MTSPPPLRFDANDADGSRDFVELSLALGDELPADLLITVRVQTTGFTAVVDTWIARGSWDSFCDGLAELEKTRQGKTSLESISPGELELSVRSTSRAGSMAIEGLVGTRTRSEVRMAFSPLPFCPTALPELAQRARAWETALAPPKAVWNPPAERGAWRGLSEEAKRVWLREVQNHHFEKAKAGWRPLKQVGQTLVIDGAQIEDLPSFFCAIGEAVNGPGGYWGSHMVAFYDVLQGGFGLDAPCTIRWRNSAKSRRILNNAALIAELEREVEAERRRPGGPLIEEDVFAEQLAQARCGARTMFDRIVEAIETRSGDGLCLVLE